MAIASISLGNVEIRHANDDFHACKLLDSDKSRCAVSLFEIESFFLVCRPTVQPEEVEATHCIPNQNSRLYRTRSWPRSKAIVQGCYKCDQPRKGGGFL